MNNSAQNIYRLKKHDWTPLLSFGGGATRTTTADGWHNTAFGVIRTRTLGLRYKDSAGNIIAHKIANRSTYDTYDSQAGYTMDVKYDISKLTAIWYRYRYVNGVLQPFNSMPDLRLFSIREHNTDFGYLDFSGNSKLSHFDVSTHFSTESYLGGSITSIEFHPDAPLKYVYLSGCVIPTAVVDACLTQCYIHRNTLAPDGIENTRSFLSQRVSWSASLQYMVDELITLGWTGFTFY